MPDARIRDVLRILEGLVPGAPVNEDLDEMDRVQALLKRVAEGIADSKRRQEETEARLEDLVEVITRMASLDFTHQASSSERGDMLDAVASGLNMLQEELRHSTVSRAYLDGVMRSMSDMLIVTRPDGRVKSVNQAALTLLGYEESELVGQPMSMVCGEAGSGRACDAVKIAAHGGTVPQETTFRTREGREIPVSCSCSLMQSKGERGGDVVCAAQDITTRKRSEQFMHDQSTFSMLRAEIWKLAAQRDLPEKDFIQGLLDHVGPVLKVSRACYDVLEKRDGAGERLVVVQEWCAPGVSGTVGHALPGQLVQTMLGEGFKVFDDRTVLERLPPVVRAAATPVIRKMIEAFDLEKVIAIPFVYEGVTEGVFAFDVCHARTQEPVARDVMQSVLEELLSIMTLVVERRRADSALKDAKDAAEEMAARAQEANLAKGEFISVMSHEIRTPMTAIVGMTEALELTDLDEEQNELVGVMSDAEKTLVALLNDVLDLSRAETGRITLESIDFDFRVIAEQRVAMVREQARAANCSVHWLVGDDVPHTMQGDPNRLGQVITNLLGNAVKFTTDGEVRLTARVAERRHDAVLLQVSVADTGVGIPPDKVDTIFETFAQADASTTRKYGGSGLGLAICRRLVELMGGRIWVDSVPGQGSVFHCTVLLGAHPARTN